MAAVCALVVRRTTSDGTSPYPDIAWKSANAAVDHAGLMFALGDYGHAAHSYAWAIEDRENHPTLILQRAVVLYYAERYEEAIASLHGVLAVDATKFEHLVWLVAAVARSNGGDYGAARAFDLLHGNTTEFAFANECVEALYALFRWGGDRVGDLGGGCGELDRGDDLGFKTHYFLAIYADAGGTGDAASRAAIRRALETRHARDNERDFFVRAAEAHAIARGAFNVADCPCEDDLDFVDKYGDVCGAHAGHDCHRYTLSLVYDYSRDDQRTMLAKCPRSCGLCERDCAGGEL